MKPDNYPSKKDVLTDPILRKGHVHKQRVSEPDVCPDCLGTGTITDRYVGTTIDCPTCEGSGEIYNEV